MRAVTRVVVGAQAPPVESWSAADAAVTANGWGDRFGGGAADPAAVVVLTVPAPVVALPPAAPPAGVVVPAAPSFATAGAVLSLDGVVVDVDDDEVVVELPAVVSVSPRPSSVLEPNAVVITTMSSTRASPPSTIGHRGSAQFGPNPP